MRIFSNTPDHICFSGSKDFAVDIGNTSVGPWTQIADGQLETSTPFLRREIFFDEPHFGRFIQYRCITGFGSYCGLQYIGVFNTGGVPMCICEQGNKLITILTFYSFVMNEKHFLNKLFFSTCSFNPAHNNSIKYKYNNNYHHNNSYFYHLSNRARH